MKFILFTLCCFLTFGTYAQGGCDIQYIEVDSINNGYIGKEVRLDFVSHKEPIWNSSKIKDTIQKQVSGKVLVFAEQRVRYVDMWYYSQQSNKCLNCDSTKYVLLDRSSLLEVGISKLKFKLFFDYFDKPKGTLLFTKIEEVWFNKSELSGVFTKF